MQIFHIVKVTLLHHVGKPGRVEAVLISTLLSKLVSPAPRRISAFKFDYLMCKQFFIHIHDQFTVF